MNLFFEYDLEPTGGDQIRTGMEDIVSSSAVLPTLSEGLEIELSGSDAENVTLKGDYLLQVVEIEVGGVQSILEVCYMCLFKSLGSMVLRGSVSTNLFHPMRHQVDLRTVELGIQLLGNIHRGAVLIPPGVDFPLVL